MPLPVPPNLRNVPGSPKTNTGKSKGKAAPGHPVSGHSLVVETAVQLVGVSLMAILAGMGDQVGKIMVTIMAGWMLLWAITNVTDIQGIINKTGL